MNRLITHTAKTLAMLAVLLLPVQQSMAAATCCCHGGLEQTGCCSQGKANCCGGADRPGQSCCNRSSLDSESGSCQCLGGRCGRAAPDVFAPSADSSSEVDLSAATVQGISSFAFENATRDSLADAVSAGPASGFERCVRLCRFRL